METTRYEVDCVIVGAGLAGIFSAIKLLENNKSVLILDRDTRPNIGGQATESFGGVFMVDSPVQRRMKIKDNPEMAYQDWCDFSQYEEDCDLEKKWAKNFIENSTSTLFDGLKKYGVKYFPVVHWVERGLHTPGNSVPRFHMVWGTGYGLIKRLVAALEAFEGKGKLTLKFGHKVDNLIEQNGTVVGVSGISQDQVPFEAKCQHVILACGGIGANLDLVRSNWYRPWGSPPKDLLVGCNQYNDGLLHTKVEEIGGKIQNLDKLWSYAAGIPHPHPRKPNHGLSLVPTKSALWMNAKGERIGPTPLITAFDTRYLVDRVCQQEGGYSWQILNRKIAIKELAVSGSEHNPTIRDEKLVAFLLSVLFGNSKLVDDFCRESSHFIVADTLADLTKKMNAINAPYHIDETRLHSEIKRYDDMIDRGENYHNDDQLRRIAQLRKYKGDKLRTCKFQKILDPGAGPLMAIKMNILVRKSLGGMKTDLSSRVLKNDGSLIKGLYAVGEAAGFGGGGIHGLRSLEGTFLGNCVYNAKVAVESILAGN